MARTVHTTPCVDCGTPLTLSTLAPTPPNLEVMKARVRCYGDGCDPDQGELADEDDSWVMDEEA